MSGKPSEKGVGELRGLIKNLRMLGAEITDLRAKTMRLKHAEEAYGRDYNAVVALLKEMDTDNTGNSGWHGRLVWLLGELDRQAMEDTLCMMSVADATAHGNDVRQQLNADDDLQVIAEHVSAYLPRVGGEAMAAWMNALISPCDDYADMTAYKGRLLKLNTALAAIPAFHAAMERFHVWKQAQKS